MDDAEDPARATQQVLELGVDEPPGDLDDVFSLLRAEFLFLALDGELAATGFESVELFEDLRQEVFDLLCHRGAGVVGHGGVAEGDPAFELSVC